MEDKIKEYRNYYLSTPTPMSDEEGFEDLLVRLEKEDKTPFLKHSFLYIGVVIIVLAILASSLFMLPDNSTTQAIKNAPAKFYNSIFAPSVTTIDPPTDKINVKPTSTPSPVITNVPTTSDKNSQTAPGQSVMELKKSQGNSHNGNVKGVSDAKKPGSIPLQLPQQAHDNASNNAGKNNENSQNEGAQNQVNSNNPAQEKSNGKAKNN